MEMDKELEMEKKRMRQMYEEYISELVQKEGGTMDAMMEREPYLSWLIAVLSPWRKYKHCRYCESFTGDDTTGCAGQAHPCAHFQMDRILVPSEIYREYRAVEEGWD